MIRNALCRIPGLGVGLLCGLLTPAPGPAMGQVSMDRIQFTNSMTASVTLLIQARERSSPTSIVLPEGRTVAVNLMSAGPFTVRVIPHDQQNSGYVFRDVNLRMLAQVVDGPLDFTGEFEDVWCPQCYRWERVRVAVHLDAYTWDGRQARDSAWRIDYGADPLGGMPAPVAPSFAVPAPSAY